MPPQRNLDGDLLRPSGALLGAQIALAAAIDRCAVEGIGHDPTIIDLLVRIQLAPDNRLRAVDLCNQLLLSPSHVSRVLDRAEDVGLVTREPDPGDRRASQIIITPEGRNIVDRFAPRLHAVLDHTIYQTLDSAEIDTLIGLLDRVEAAARTCQAETEEGTNR